MGTFKSSALARGASGDLVIPAKMDHSCLRQPEAQKGRGREVWVAHEQGPNP